MVEDEKSDMAAIEGKVKQSEMLEADLRRMIEVQIDRLQFLHLTRYPIGRAEATCGGRTHNGIRSRTCAQARQITAAGS